MALDGEGRAELTVAHKGVGNLAEFVRRDDHDENVVGLCGGNKMTIGMQAENQFMAQGYLLMET